MQLEPRRKITRPPAADLAADGEWPRVLVVDDERETIERIERWAAQHFVKLELSSSVSDALARASGVRLDAAIVATELGGAAGYELGQKLLSLHPRLPIAFIGTDDRAETRARAARAGGTIFIAKPLADTRLADAAGQLIVLGRPQPRRVLVLDPDAGFRSEARRALEAAGFEVTALSEVRDLMRLLESAEPDALVIDLTAPAIGALDVCRIVRTSSGWQDLPILLVTTQASEVVRLRAFRAGSDDVLEKPISVSELVARVETRVERRRALQARLGRDPLTGLPLRRAFIDRVRARLSEARRHRQLLSVCLIDLDRFKSINDRFGHLAGDRVLSALGLLLSSHLRAEDLSARWGGEEFALALPRQDRVAAEQAVRKLLAELSGRRFVADDGSEHVVSFSAGIATFPADGDGLERLLRVADERLYAAKRAGRARIVAG